MCDFCEEFGRPRTSRSRIVIETERFVAVPTIGCFVDGYLLLLPKLHVASFAQLGAADLRDGLKIAAMLAKKLSSVYGTYILAEHGTGPCDFGAACVDHAHLHLIPLGQKARQLRDRYVHVGGPPAGGGGPEQFQRFSSSSYVALATNSAGDFEFWHAEKFLRQFARRECAELLNVGDRWNWREHPFVTSMLRTKLLCDTLFQEEETARVCG